MAVAEKNPVFSALVSKAAFSKPRFPAILAGGISFVILCASVLGLGFNFSFYYLAFSTLAIYFLLGIMVFSGRGKVDALCFVAYGLSLVFSFFGLVFNTDNVSVTSAVLFAFLYFPFVFSLSPKKVDASGLWQWTMGAFSSIGVFCALAGIAQFAAQFVIKDAWLFNYALLLPEIFQSEGLWNRVIPAGTFIKSNGFFFAEPSLFSQFIAATLVCEWNTRKRWGRMAVCGFGLLLSYSGTGLLALLVASMFPLNYKTVLRFCLIGLAGGIVLFVLGDVLNLWFTVDRLGEFGSEGTSAYARFVAPFRLLHDRFAYEAWTPFFGNGPGSISRTVMDYEFHDPTWAKLLYEYGILGSAAIFTLVWRSITRFPIPVQVRAVFFFSWFACGGQLLSPGSTALMYVVLAMWPKPQEEENKSGNHNILHRPSGL